MSCRSYLHFLDINPLIHKCFVNILFHSIDCLFILLIVSLSVQTFFSLILSHCLFLFLLPVLLVSYPRNYCQDQCQETSFIVSFINFNSFKSHIQISNPFWVDFCVRCKIRSSTLFFCGWYPFFSSLFIEEISLSTSCVLGTVVENQFTIDA